MKGSSGTQGGRVSLLLVSVSKSVTAPIVRVSSLSVSCFSERSGETFNFIRSKESGRL